MPLPQEQSSDKLAARNFDQAHGVRFRVTLLAIGVSILICMVFLGSYLLDGEYLLFAALLPFLLPMILFGYLIWRTGRYRYVLLYLLFVYTTMGLFNLISSPVYLLDAFFIPVMSGLAFLILHVRHAALAVLYLLLLYFSTALTVYYFEPFPVLYSNDDVASLVIGFVAALIGSVTIFYYFARAYQASSASLGNSLIALSKANDDNHLMLQVLSHDFKNHLQRLLMEIDAGERELGGDRASLRFDSLRANVRHLAGLLDEVQEVRKLVEVDEVAIAELPLSLAAKKMELLFRQQLLQKNLRLVFEPHDNLVLRVNADVFLHIILANILSNALKFSPLGGLIRISARKLSTANEVVIINQAERQHLENLTKVQAGSRVIESREGTDHESGQGVGSSIVRRFCQLHGIGFSIDAVVDAHSDYLTVSSRLSISPG